MTEKSCAICVKRHLLTTGDLECRAAPPANDVGRFGRFPVVRGDHYCHDSFQLDAEAAKAVAAAKADSDRLDALVLAQVLPAPGDESAEAAPVAKAPRARRARATDEPGPLL